MDDTRRLLQFERIHDQLAELIAKTDDPIAHRATAVALLHHKIPRVSWTGFYMLRGADLIVDAYQGPVACLVLARNIGVCWAGVNSAQSLVVEDVHAFPGHIACDERSRSEVVVPVFRSDGRPVGILDVDSHEPGRFDHVDRQGYELIVRLLEQRWHG